MASKKLLTARLCDTDVYIKLEKGRSLSRLGKPLNTINIFLESNMDRGGIELTKTETLRLITTLSKLYEKM